MFVGFFVSEGQCYRGIYPTYSKSIEYDITRHWSSSAATGTVFLKQHYLLFLILSSIVVLYK